MALSSRARNFLHKSNLLIYFIVNRGVPAHAKPSIVTLFGFYKTLSGYVDTRPVDQDIYFDFKDRYQKAVEQVFLGDHFIAENYVLMWQSLEQLMGKSYAWKAWTEDFMNIKDLDLSPIQFDKEEELENYLKAHEGLGSAFCALLGWEDSLDSISRKIVWLLKHEALIINVAEDSTFSRRYLPLLNSGMLSISEIEFIKKPNAFKELMNLHLAKGREKMDEIQRELLSVPKKRRALVRTILYALRRLNKKMAHHPEVLFTKPPAYFKVSLRKLSFRLWWYGVTGIFEREISLKKG